MSERICSLFQRECVSCGQCGKITVQATRPKVRRGARPAQVKEIRADDGFVDEVPEIKFKEKK